MNMDEFKERYEELKNNPMYQKYCSVLETKDKIIKKLSSQLEQKEDNWNELKEWLEDENNQKYSQYIYNYSINNWVLNKMQEIEKGEMNE